MFNIKQLLKRRGFLATATAVVLTAATLGTAVDARAQSIEEIKAKGSFTFGIVTDQVPFGFINEKGENDGYDIELSRMMAKEMGVEPKYVVITAANRIPQLLTGKVDMLISVLGMYPDRAKVIQYVKPYAAIQAVIFGSKGDALAKVEDLSGHTVAVARASSMDKKITEIAPKDATIMRFDDDSSAVQALISGQSQVLAGFSHYFGGIEKAAPGKFEPKVVLSTEYLGIALRPNQKELTDWVNDFLTRHEQDGTVNALYKKWFNNDRPEMPASLEGIPFTVN
jgi:polar amino acid transport system substrate-binding protein